MMDGKVDPYVLDAILYHKLLELCTSKRYAIVCNNLIWKPVGYKDPSSSYMDIPKIQYLHK